MDNQEQINKWNSFIIDHNGPFLQSFEWGQFQRSLGRKIWRVENNDLKGLVIRYDLPQAKNYLYCPKGPVGNHSAFKGFLDQIKEIARQEESIFLKIEPSFDFQFDKLGFIKSKKEIQPSKTIILNIARSEDQLLNQMHSKARYNINLAQRKGVTVKEDSGKIDIFLDLAEETARRGEFYLHEESYYKKMMEILAKEGIVRLFLAEYQDKVIAANLVYFFWNTATYLYGASDHSYRRLMAPSLLQWEIIRQAKKDGFKYYDFWGINEKKWPGVTHFKRGFGGKEVSYPGAFDLVFRPVWYRIYNIARKVF